MSRLSEIDGLPVIDADRMITLKVNFRDLRHASIKNADDCVVARACRRQLHVKEARVHLTRMYLRTDNSHWTRYVVPRSMRAEIIAFDRGGSFETGEFSLYAPPPCKRLGQRRGGDDTPRTGKARRKPKRVLKNVRTGPA